MLKIGKQLRRIRTEQGYTQRQVAIAVGVTDAQISRIETDASEPEAETMAKIADFLGVRMDDLREPRSTVNPSDLEASLMAAARRAQDGDESALAEMRRLYSALGQADAERVENERSMNAPTSSPKRKRRTK